MKNLEVLEEIRKQGKNLIETKRDEFVKQNLLSDEFIQMMQKNKKPFELLMSYYQCAIMEIETKFRVLTNRIQAALPAVAECREGADAYVYHTENLGKQLGERYRFPPCFHGDASEKAGKERRADAVYSDAYRGWLPDAEGRVKEEKI